MRFKAKDFVDKGCHLCCSVRLRPKGEVSSEGWRRQAENEGMEFIKAKAVERIFTVVKRRSPSEMVSGLQRFGISFRFLDHHPWDGIHSSSISGSSSLSAVNDGLQQRVSTVMGTFTNIYNVYILIYNPEPSS